MVIQRLSSFGCLVICVRHWIGVNNGEHVSIKNLWNRHTAILQEAKYIADRSQLLRTTKTNVFSANEAMLLDLNAVGAAVEKDFKAMLLRVVKGRS